MIDRMRIFREALSEKARRHIAAARLAIDDFRLTTEDIRDQVDIQLYKAREVMTLLDEVDPGEVNRIGSMFAPTLAKLNAYLLGQEPIDRETDAHNAQAEKKTATEVTA